MGSINLKGLRSPDVLCFANWKRLNDTPWKFSFIEGRNFNLLPYSISDSAVAYYYEPEVLGRAKQRNFTILLASESTNGFASYKTALLKDLPRVMQESDAVLNSNNQNIYSDLILIRDVLNQIEEFIGAGAILSIEELNALELVITRIQSRNGQY